MALYYSKIKYSIVENGETVHTSRYDLMARIIKRIAEDNVLYVTPSCYDAENDSFTAGYKLGKDGKLVKVEKSFVPKIVVDRGFFGPRNPNSKIPIISDRDLRSTSLDKFKMYDQLTQFMPKSVKFDLSGSDITILDGLGDNFIVKARRGSGGSSIWLMNKTEFSDKLKSGQFTSDLLIQELVESDGASAGLGFAGRHDVRLFVAGDKVVGTYIRRPADGQYISNVNKGGALTVPSISSLPKGLLDFASGVISALPGKLRIFSIDCFYDSVAKEWKVIEINANAGIPSATYGLGAVECLDGIADYVAQAYNKAGAL